VSDDSTPAASISFDNARAALAGQGYALMDDREVGLTEKFRATFLQKYFNDNVLRHDDGDWPVDRKRARDVIRYQWSDNGLHLWEHETISLTDRSGIPGKRDHSRVMLLADPWVGKLVYAFLSLMPPSRRQCDGTFSINLFRTLTNVVTSPHHDGEEFTILYVLDRIGEGAESYLYLPDDVRLAGQSDTEPVLKQQLNPGQMLIFDDRLFLHWTTPLVPPPSGRAKRDTLVCTIDYRSTYLGQARRRPSQGWSFRKPSS
jgi:hypothetical protein